MKLHPDSAGIENAEKGAMQILDIIESPVAGQYQLT
jgi:hypothetical protein